MPAAPQVEFEAGAALPALEALALRARGAYRGVWPALPRFARLRSLTLAAPVSMDTEGCEAALLVRGRGRFLGPGLFGPSREACADWADRSRLV